MRWRRATSVFGYWLAGQFVVENYRMGIALSANPITIQVLHLFSDWCSLEEAHRKLPEYSCQSLRRSIQELVRQNLLLREGSPQAADDERFAEGWASWLPHAAVLHFGTKDMPYTNSHAQIARQLRAYLKESPQPSFFKSSRHPSKILPLPKIQLADSSFTNALLSRRTHREFSSKPLDLKDLSTLLSCTWGVTRFLNVPLLGPLPQKTSPSAGARHPCEVYILARRVTNLAPGLYHYAARQARFGTSVGRGSHVGEPANIVRGRSGLIKRPHCS